MSRWIHPSLCAGLALMAAAPVSAAEQEVTLQKINYKDLGKAVRGHKGKVVVVDFWAVT